MKLGGQSDRFIALRWRVCRGRVTAILAQAVPASTADLAPLVVGPRTLPVPTSEVSPEMQPIIAVKPDADLYPLVKTGEEARVFADAQAAVIIKRITGLLTRLYLTMTAATIDGVRMHSRLTIQSPARPAKHCDIVSKISPLSDRIAIAYSGDVQLASILLQKILAAFALRKRRDLR